MDPDPGDPETSGSVSATLIFSGYFHPFLIFFSVPERFRQFFYKTFFSVILSSLFRFLVHRRDLVPQGFIGGGQPSTAAAPVASRPVSVIRTRQGKMLRGRKQRSSLKVPSGQIRSAWEWYLWIGLEKDKNDSNFLLFRHRVRKESFRSIGLRNFIWWKNQPKCCTILVWIAGCTYSTHGPSSKEQLLTLFYFLEPGLRWKSCFRSGVVHLNFIIY